MVGDSLGLLTMLNVTVAWARNMEYAAVWVPKHTIMILDSARSGRELDEAIELLMPEVRLRALPSHPPRQLGV